jgi:uncharacterized membrane protein
VKVLLILIQFHYVTDKLVAESEEILVSLLCFILFYFVLFYSITVVSDMTDGRQQS